MSERNCSPLAAMEKISRAAETFLKEVESCEAKKELMAKDIEDFRKAIEEAKLWKIGELFPSNRHIPIIFKDV